ncbi:nuclease [Virgibacillus profundi]|uniref:Nuclease n=1 Tax=Virgibacillus profundi TaxID=2024555 RepID=A0A2A2I7X1_9BACI|nr:nuclease-related domain-containing protein [Virgibacillus profundi]PAV27819.1 nuclease [Virgibacillus profundi]PXY51946.1 NERD domain-containing protein [Virgibacillus profundi]
MPYKSRVKSTELLTLEYLNYRMNLPGKNKQHYLNLLRGFEGEVQFDSLTEKLQCDCIILNDLLLKINNTYFQIDTIIITSHTIYIFEVKNYEGDYYYGYDEDKFYKIPDYEITNPLHQLSRSESLLRQLFLKQGIKLPIKASVILINPGFNLYQAPLYKPFIFSNQINRHLSKINSTPTKLNGKHKLIADKLMSLHIEESPFTQLPDYSYNQLKKGITCVKCNSFSVTFDGRMCVCAACGHGEKEVSAVMRVVKEFTLLFPELKITTSIIHEWCQAIASKKIIRRILKQNFTMTGSNRGAYFK